MRNILGKISDFHMLLIRVWLSAPMALRRFGGSSKRKGLCLFHLNCFPAQCGAAGRGAASHRGARNVGGPTDRPFDTKNKNIKGRADTKDELPPILIRVVQNFGTACSIPEACYLEKGSPPLIVICFLLPFAAKPYAASWRP